MKTIKHIIAIFLFISFFSASAFAQTVVQNEVQVRHGLSDVLRADNKITFTPEDPYTSITFSMTGNQPSKLRVLIIVPSQFANADLWEIKTTSIHSDKKVVTQQVLDHPADKRSVMEEYKDLSTIWFVNEAKSKDWTTVSTVSFKYKGKNKMVIDDWYPEVVVVNDSGKPTIIYNGIRGSIANYKTGKEKNFEPDMSSYLDFFLRNVTKVDMFQKYRHNPKIPNYGEDIQITPNAVGKIP